MCFLSLHWRICFQYQLKWWMCLLIHYVQCWIFWRKRNQMVLYNYFTSHFMIFFLIREDVKTVTSESIKKEYTRILLQAVYSYCLRIWTEISAIWRPQIPWHTLCKRTKYMTTCWDMFSIHVVTEFNTLNGSVLNVKIKLTYTTTDRFIISFKSIFFIDLKL